MKKLLNKTKKHKELINKVLGAVVAYLFLTFIVFTLMYNIIKYGLW